LNMHCAKILIVEDEVIVADNIKNSLGKNGYRVASLAASGENAVLIAEKENLDIVIMDIVLKGELDGINAADQIRKQFGIPVIFLTAYSDNEIFQSAKITEPFGYITKPFDIKQLILNIEIALYKSEMEKEKEKLIHELQKEISERKLAEEALLESEEKFRSAFDNANTGMCLVDLDGHFTKVNIMMCEIFGYSEEELENMTVKDLTHPEDTQVRQEFVKNAISGEIESAHFENRYIHKQGHILWCQVASSLVREIDGDPLYFVSQVRDITANREMEQEIKELAKFPSEDPCPVLRVKKNGIILYANRASQPVLDIWGYQVGQVLTGNWLDAVMEVHGSGLHKEIEIEYHDHIYRLMFAFIAEADYVNVYGLEITDIKSAERQLISDQQRLRSLARELSLTEDRERRRIAEFLHDEIGQMLVAILMKLCELKEIEDSPKKTQLIDEIRDLLSQTIDNTRSATFELSPLILHELGFEPAIEWVCEKISEEHNLMIEFRNDSNPKLVKDDIGVFLFRAIRELLINVVKHSHATRAEVSILRKGDCVSIDVADNGIGFNKVKLNANLWGDMVFGIFNIQERIDSFDGTLEIVSEPGQGARITLSVPMKSDDSSVKVGTP